VTQRRFLLSFELNVSAVPTDVSYILYTFAGGATAQLHGDSSGVSLFTTGGPGIVGTGGFGTGWRHVEWLVDFNDGGTRVEVGGVPVVTNSLGALVTTGASGAREIRVGIPYRSPFDVGVQVLMDDVLVTTP
jgi:hypothetical protein